MRLDRPGLFNLKRRELRKDIVEIYEIMKRIEIN